MKCVKNHEKTEYDHDNHVASRSVRLLIKVVVGLIVAKRDAGLAVKMRFFLRGGSDEKVGKINPGLGD